MKQKIYILILTLVMCLTATVSIPNDYKVEATGGYGGDDEGNNIGLDLDFMWNITMNLTNVIHDKNIYPDGTIHKGREFGSDGDKWTADYLNYTMIIGLGLENVTKIPIQNISGKPNWLYNYTVSVIDYNLTINGQGYQSYQYPSTVPQNETYARPTGSRNLITGGLNFLKINYNNSFTNLKIVPIDLTKNLTYTIDYLNITYDNITEYNETIGNATYISINDELPIDQDARVFLLDEEEGVNEQLENITSNASVVILIHDNNRGNFSADTTKCNASVIARTQSSNSNLTTIIELLQNDTIIIAANFDNYNTFTFSYNLNCTNWPWCNNDFLYVTPHGEYGYGIDGKFGLIAIRNFFECIPLLGSGALCRGIIAYDLYNNTHLMWPAHRRWMGWSNTLLGQSGYFIYTYPKLQMFLVNKSVGEALENISDDQDASVSGYMEQAEAWVDAYNVIGNITIEQSPCDMITVISNRYDSMESEAPGDSGAGAGIVLGIAKYFIDHNITPKYNLTFLMTTGEEYGYRGAWHYSHTHPENESNITQWIGLDQLGFNTTGSYLNPMLSDNTTTGNIIWAIANDTRYEERTGYGFSNEEGGNGLDAYPFQAREENCNTIGIHKNAAPNWLGHHRSGIDFQEGDSMNYIDREDLNVTFEFSWNVVKYFCVDPDCWFSNVTFEAFDSNNDGDTLDDSIIANFSLNTILPYDLMMVNASLINSSSEEVVSNTIVNYTITSAGSERSITVSIPDDDTVGNYSLSLKLYNSTGKINETIGISDVNQNDTSSSDIFHLFHPFGYIKNGSSYKNIEDNITGSVFTANENAYADNITAYINKIINSPGPYKCMLYRLNDSKLIGNTSENWTSRDNEDPPLSTGWAVFNFSEPKPVLVQGTQYVITCWGEDGYSRLYYDDFSSQRGRYNQTNYISEPPDYPSFNNENRLYSIYCSYTALNYGPNITSVNSNPDVTGFGMNVVISANVSDIDGVETVKVNIVKPQTDPGLGSSYTMNNTGGDIYEYVFNDTWIIGQYNYTIWAIDEKGYSNTSSQYSFNISAKATVTVCTIQDEYGNNTFVNITDPPGDPPIVGYELLDDGKVLRIWNNYDSYYFNTSSGIQLTNHYNEYWSHNVFILGYYNNNQWNLIYRTDELSGFNKNIDSDNETYVNATLWKDLTYQGYDFRLAIRYHLGVYDKELTVIPYIKNLGQAIPYTLGFAWELKDIQVDMTPSGDYIEVNGTTYLLNQSLDETYKNMTMSCFYICEDISSDRSESLYLCWNDSLDYLVNVKSRDGQYNAPVTLGIKIGTLGVSQEKYTSLLWHDASEITYYFNSYSIGETWASNPSYMVDGSTSTYASTTVNSDVELCNGNNCSGSNLGNIALVEFRVYGYYSGTQRDIILRPVFSGTIDGLNQYYSTGSTPAWSRWFDITTDPYGPQTWNWTDVDNLDCDVEAKSGIGFFTLYCSKVEIRVTYIPNNNPIISDPVPADGSTGISIAPLLNITVADPDGDNMNITWLSNSSGSWQVFGTNNSIYNGTYHQTMSNASNNGKWWYWKVNVTDGINYTESSVYKFYTGNQSKIKNTGSTNFSGYLLMQVQFFDGYNWVIAGDNCPNETTPRTIPVGGQFGLDTVFNGKIHTAYLIGVFGAGLYRVYACFRDPYGNVLACDDDSLMEATYEFTVNL